MRIHDTEIEFRTPVGTVEITEYHDEREGVFVGPRHWNARIIVVEDGGIGVINLHRDSQQDLYQALEDIKDLFEAASTAVLDAIPHELEGVQL